MTLFKIDAKTTAYHFVGGWIAFGYLVLVLIEVVPILIIGLTSEMSEKFFNRRLHRMYNFAHAWLHIVGVRSDKFSEWLDKTFTTDSEKMWKELSAPLAKDEDKNDHSS